MIKFKTLTIPAADLGPQNPMPDIKNVSYIHADYELTPVYPTSRLVENKSKSIFLIEATQETADYINGLLRLQLIDEIILYTVPFIAGTGRHLFKANLPSSHWNLVEKKEYNGSILRAIYRKKCIQE